MLKGKKILMVVAPQNFRDEEFSGPKKIFEDAGASVVVASTTMSTATGMFGMKVKPDIVISQVDSTQYDAIVVVGGSGSKQYLWGDTGLQDLISKANREGKVIGAICLSPVILARAGILEGKSATVFPSGDALDELKRGGAIYVDRDAVVSGNIVTGNGPEAAETFGNKIFEKIK